MWLIWAVIGRGFDRGSDDRAADRVAVSGMVRGDQNALADIYDRHARPVYSLALRILQDSADAEDVVQEVFTQAWRTVSTYDAARGAVGAWLLTMTRTRAIDRLRARHGRQHRLVNESRTSIAHDPTALQDVQLVTAEEVTAVRAALAALPALQRVAIELAYYEGLTHAEIAAQLEEPLGTVKTRIRAAMQKLRAALAEAV